MDVKISKELSELRPGAALMVLSYEAEVKESSAELLALLDKTIDNIHSRYTMTDLAELIHIKDTRTAYRNLGKSPTAYRNAAEAMLRRIVKGNGLYHINNVVEINNLISITTGYSVGSYDTDCLSGTVEWKRAPDGESYLGIGKDILNIEHLPTLYDEKGAFGNPTSDSRRAMISPGIHRISSVVYSFSGNHELDLIASQYQELLIAHCRAKEIDVKIIS
ncbi:B3/B4 domain-containing protein [Lutispora saccharofermentans]|uniref:B3/B4 tRNA-binding domain-containing protein n=1 Tax=Lutispora saccharofermentans TaxID=3024236 RepID=A0ABT1NE61_9FIRM|nr:phenylalanine--tRNA ligase beta subunit-related protein [Lutispora saccharofermentans]MCQ1529344.1 hypothetical protein [Lutispora saccharofermentans]